MKHYLRHYVIVILCVVTIAGCAKPKVTVSIVPRYPCLGEDVIFSYSLKNLDRIEVKNGKGDILKSGSGQSGSFQITNIDQSMLPITAKGWQGNKSKKRRIPGDLPFRIIEGTIETESFALNNKVLKETRENQIGTEDCGCVYQGTQPVVCNEQAPILEVTDVYEGQEATLDSVLFSERARVVNVTNDSPFNLTYVHGNNVVGSVSSNASQAVNFTDDLRPAGRWQGKYEANNFHEIFRGIFVKGKLCGGWASRTPGDVRRDVSVKLSLRCNQ